MTTLEEWEEEAGENAHRVIILVQAGRRDELTEFVRSLDQGDTILAMYALAAGLLRQERANEEGAERIRTLEAGALQLLADKKKLSEDLASVQEDRAKQARKIGAQRETLKMAGFA